MNQFIIPLILSWFSLSTYAYDRRTDCVVGIQTDVSSFTFEGSGPEDYYPNICTNELGVRSIWAAAKLYCSAEEIQAGSKLFGGWCEQYGMVTLTPYDQILPELTDSFIDGSLVVNFEDINASKIWNESILISRAFYTAGARTTAVFSAEMDTHHRYGYAMYGFWGGLLLIGTVHNLFKRMAWPQSKSCETDLEGSSTDVKTRTQPSTLHRLVSPIAHVVQTHFIIPAAFGTHDQRLFYGATIPTRIEAVMLAAFYLLTLVLCCVSYEAFWPNLYYTPAMQICRYVADRTGIIAYSLLPILWMFSGRNNVFLWVTGWSFATFNMLHRHIARVTTILAIVHSIAYTVMEVNYHELAESWREQYWYMGGLAIISMSLIVPLSSPWVRHKSYEVFLLLHIAFSILVIISLFFHTKIFDGEYNGYLWPLVAIWCFDRVARIVPLVYCNIHLKVFKNAIGTTATATYSQESDIIRLQITPKSQLLKPSPGQHYFVYQPLKWKGWENHPFTLAAWNHAQSDGISNTTANPSLTKTPELSTTEEIQVASPTHSSSDSDSASSSKQNVELSEASIGQYTLLFLIRPFDGWTKRLRDECLKAGGPTVCPKVLVEGPYGERSPLHRYENVLMIAGGSGITAGLAYLQDHIARSKVNSTVGSTYTRDITVIWTTKQSAMISDVAANELKTIIGREDIHVHFYATSRKESPRTVSTVNAKMTDKLVVKDRNELNISYGRPDVTTMITSVIDEVHAAGSKGGKTAVSACGPVGLADECRATVHAALKRGRCVDYIEESFGW